MTLAAVPRRRAARTVAAMIVFAVLAAVVAFVPAVGVAPAAHAAAGSPGTPSDPVSLYQEDFENGVESDPVSLSDYASSSGVGYNADTYWLDRAECNGFVVSQSTPLNDTDCSDADLGDPVRQQSFQQTVRQMVGAIAEVNGGDAATNSGLAELANETAPSGQAVFETTTPLPLNGANGRYVVFSVDAAATTCNATHANLTFYAASGGTETPLNATPIDPCNTADSRVSELAPTTAINTGAVYGGRFSSDGSVLVTGASLGLVLRNVTASADGNGNDFAIDDIQVLDATPQLDKSFDPATIKQGQSATLTFTITNTSELAAKDGWSFTDTLPDGLSVTGPAASTTCAAGSVTAPAGAASIGVTGNLNAGQASCTVTVHVTSDTVGSYTNGPDNVTTTGLNPPADANLNVTSNAWTCSTFGYLFQTPNATTHQIYQVDLVTGASQQIGTTADSVNAVGYNTLDNFVYGWNSDSMMVRVGADGTETSLGHPAGIPAGVNFNVGDIDHDGHYFVTSSRADPDWYEIDLVPGSATYGQVIDSGSFTTPRSVSALPSDWAFINGKFYGLVDSPAHLIEYDPASNTASDLGTLAGTGAEGGGYGAVYADAAGYLYASDNSTGFVVRVDLNTHRAVKIANGPSSGGNDGTRCPTAPIPTITVAKQVDGRVLPDDQFTVGLQQADGTVLTSVTTEGTDTSASTDDWPVQANTAYTITDAMADGSPDALTAYDPTISCVDSTSGEPVDTSGDVGAWQVTSTDADPIVCTVTNAPGTPAFSISKTASAGTAVPGGTIDYAITVTNTSSVPYTAAVPAHFDDDLSGVLDDASYDNDATEGATVSGTTLSWTGPLAVGATTVVTYSVTVDDPDTGDKLLHNAIVPPTRGSGGSCDPADACTTDTPVQSYHVTKTADTDTIAPGKTVTYTIAVENTGQVAYTADDPASFTDDLSGVLDDATYNDDVSGGATYAEPSISWSGPLDVGQTLTFTYSVTLNSPDMGDGELENGVVTDGPGGGCPAGSLDPDCRTEVPSKSFSLVKTASANEAGVGTKVTYTVTVTNTGKADFTADGPASFTDDLSGVLDDAAYNGDATQGATVSGKTLSWSGPLAVGAVVAVTYSVTVDTPDTGDHSLKNAVTTSDEHGSCEPGDCVTTTPIRDFAVVKKASASSVKAGDTITYTLTVTATGTAPYTAERPAKLHDDLSGVLDDAAYNGDATQGATVSGKTLSWAGPLALGERLTITYSVTVDAPDTGDQLLKNAVVADNGSGPGDPKDGSVETPVASFHVTKTASGSDTTPGSVVSYTITVENTGKADYTSADPAAFTDDLSQVLDDARYNGDATSGATYRAPTLSWSGPLAVGKEAIITYSVTVAGQDDGDGKLDNAVVTPLDGNCPSGSTGEDCAVETLVGPSGPLAFTGTDLVPAALIALLLGGVGAAILTVGARLRRRFLG
ncbi:MAG TPA: hypothetical protein VGC45_16490 [Gryllotalpicola sp.]